MDDGVAVGVDVGGTFTDVVLVADGELTTTKVPTTRAQHEGVLAGVDRACEDAGVSADAVDRFRHGTTVAVNALLEDDCATTALVTTAGFEDVLAIRRQDRPKLYDLTARRPDPIVPAERRFGVPERATPDGVEMPVDEAAVREVAAQIRTMETAAGAVEAVAVAFLHAYAHPENEARTATILREELDVPVSASHEVLPTVREYERTATTAANAALTPVVDEYLDRLSAGARERGLPTPGVVQATGGVATPAAVRDRAVTAVHSGPAAGVVGAAALAPDDADGLVTFDVGGTSTDVSLVTDGDVARTTEGTVGDHPLAIPMVDVETVGAGGGSIARVDAGGALRVGPESAGARPGPACYGRGGDDATVTDAALELGFLADGDSLGDASTTGDAVTLDGAAARSALSALAGPADLDGPTAVARGILDVALATTARAVRRVTVERGRDPRGMALAAYGGAGPMLAAPLADRLGIETVLVPPASGVWSAYGLLAADETRDAVRTHKTILDDADPDAIDDAYATLTAEALSDLTDPGDAELVRRAECRYDDQRHELTVDVPDPFDPGTVRERFHAVHERERGYRRTDTFVGLVTLSVTARRRTDPPSLEHRGGGDGVETTRPVVFDDDPGEAIVLDRGALATGRTVAGPAVLTGAESTTVCPPGWTATVADDGRLRLEGSG